MKNTKGEMVVMCLTLRAKQPKRGVVTGDKGYIEVYEYPRACKATFTNTATGEVETVEAGKTEDALKYEVEAMEAAIEGNLEDDCQIIFGIFCQFLRFLYCFRLTCKFYILVRI